MFSSRSVGRMIFKRDLRVNLEVYECFMDS